MVGLLFGQGAKKSAAARGSKSNGEQVCHLAKTYLRTLEDLETRHAESRPSSKLQAAKKAASWPVPANCIRIGYRDSGFSC